MRPLVFTFGVLAAVTMGGCGPAVPFANFAVSSASFTLDRLEGAVPAPVETARFTPPAASEPPRSATESRPPSPRPKGGGGAPPPPGTFQGVVVTLEGVAERPLAGATVRTSDGREATTGVDGRFRLEGGLASDTALVASLPGYLASAVSGVTGSGLLTVHLRPATTVNEDQDSLPQIMTARGRVVGPDGLPVANVLVVLEDARGSHSAPASTDASGAFALTVFAVGGRVENGTLLAVGTAGDEWVGLETGVDLVNGTQNIDLEPDQAGLEPFEVTRPTHPLRVDIDNSQTGLPSRATVFLTAADGTSLSLPMDGDRVKVADLPGARYSLRADAMALTGDAQSQLYREAIAVDFAAAETVVSGALLAPPTVVAPTALEPQIGWTAVAGARAYHVALESLSTGPIWEGFTSLLTLPLVLPGNPIDLDRLTVTAWDADGLSVRQVAHTDARSLRLLPEVGTFRRSARQVRISP